MSGYLSYPRQRLGVRLRLNLAQPMADTKTLGRERGHSSAKDHEVCSARSPHREQELLVGVAWLANALFLGKIALGESNKDIFFPCPLGVMVVAYFTCTSK